ncbi:MAG: aspartate kinase [Clostridia bacterium]|nr:aspartate kinase [Clostridia bacterium]
MRLMTKFGGSSLADAAQFKKVKAIVEADESRSFVVVSAPGKRDSNDEKITDLLLQCYDRRESNLSFAPLFMRIRQRFCDIERELGLDVGIESELLSIERAIQNGASSDFVASRGEYLTGLLLAAYLGFGFMDPCELIAFHDDGTYDDETTQRWCQKLDGKKRLVIPGFYGRKRDGSIKTFSRGGSDITGAIIARAVGADVYENWTDVDGFMMADPRIVDSPRIMSVVTYSELRELSYMGAGVLHEDSIFPVRRARIPIHVRNTNKPDAKGTKIVPDGSVDAHGRGSVLTGVAGRSGFTIITVTKDNMHKEVGFGYRLLRVLSHNNISFENCPSGIDTMSIIIDDSFLKGKLDAVISEIRRDCEPNTIEVTSQIALIAAVGKGMVRSVGVSSKLFSALSEAGINVRVINQSSSEMNIIVGVEQRDFKDAVNAVYRAFNP